MTGTRRMLLNSAAHGLWLGSVAAAFFAGIKAYEAYGPWTVAGICLIATSSLFMLLAVCFNEDDAARAIELRAALSYALENSGSMALFIRLYVAGNRQSLQEFFPTWPQFLADAQRKAGDA
jgi:hypothetical protein